MNFFYLTYLKSYFDFSFKYLTLKKIVFFIKIMTIFFKFKLRHSNSISFRFFGRTIYKDFKIKFITNPLLKSFHHSLKTSCFLFEYKNNNDH